MNPLSNSNKNAVIFSVGDTVNTPYGKGEVWKVTQDTVHVRHNYKISGIAFLYSTFYINPKEAHHNPVSLIAHVKISDTPTI